MVLHDQGGDPYVVRGNRRALLSKLPVEAGVAAGRHVARKENPYAGLGQKPLESAFVLEAFLPKDKPGPQLGHHDEREKDRLGFLHKPGDLEIVSAEIRIAVGVQSDSQRHSSGSILR